MPDLTQQLAEGPMTCACGLPMSRNPHPRAGDPTMDGVEIGHVWVCIPCTVRTRSRWARRAMRAESDLAAALDALASFRDSPHRQGDA